MSSLSRRLVIILTPILTRIVKSATATVVASGRVGRHAGLFPAPTVVGNLCVGVRGLGLRQRVKELVDDLLLLALQHTTLGVGMPVANHELLRGVIRASVWVNDVVHVFPLG